MTMGKIAARIGYAVAALLLFVSLTILFIPNRAILDAVNHGLAVHGLTFSATEFDKAFPLGVSGRGWTLSSTKGKLLSLESASLKLRLLPLLAAKLVFSLEARSGSGSIKATASSSANGTLHLEIKGLNLEQVPFFASVTGSDVAGIINCQTEISGAKGKGNGFIKLDAQGVELRGVKIGETPLPDATYQTVQAMIRVSGGTASIESFTLQGSGLYARLRGNILPGAGLPAAPLNMTLELMPKPDFLDKQKFIFLLLAKYLDTPGHYQVPIKGTLGRPVME